MTSSSRLPAAVSRWLHFERFFNDRRSNRRYFVSFRRASLSVAAPYRPESATEWNLEAAFAPRRETRIIGPLESTLRRALRFDLPDAMVPVFIHPQSRGVYRRLIAERGLVQTPIVVTPTSSYRSLLAWHEDRPDTPVILKVSLDARFNVVRVIPEKDIIRATVVSSLLSAIPEATRRRHGFDFFPESAACVHRGIGYIVRRFPASFDPDGAKTLVPLFALTSRGPNGEPPLLITLIRRSRRTAESFLISHVIEPYVRALAYLILEEGLYVEGHTQNILYEVDAGGELTGTIVVRDLSSTSVNPTLRLARGKRMPALAPSEALAVKGPRHRWSASYAVEMFGLRDAIWKICRSVMPYVPALDRRRLRLACVRGYQQAAVDTLRLRPAIKRGLTGLALDEAITRYIDRAGLAGAGGRLPRR